MNERDWEEKLIEQIPPLRRYARVLTRDNHGADDLVQDCLEKAWAKRSSWRVDSNLKAWLFTIMHNVFVNSLRRKKINDNYLSSQRDVVHENRTDTNLILRDLETGLNQLKPEYREVLILASVENLSYKEISEVTGVPLGTVMSRLSRSRENLRKFLTDQSENKMMKVL